MRSQYVFAAMVLLSMSARADELTPFQKEARRSFERSISSALKEANAACGTRLKVKTNFNWFNPKDWDGVGYEDSCKEVLLGIAATCARPENKKAFARKVTGVACLFTWNLSEVALYGALDPEHPETKKKAGANDTEARNVSLSKGLLMYEMHKGDKAIADETRAVLDEALKAGSR